jgi:hypothetical protein
MRRVKRPVRIGARPNPIEEEGARREALGNPR